MTKLTFTINILTMRICNIIDYSKYTFNAEDDWGDYLNGKYREPWFNKDGYNVKNYYCTDGKSRSTFEHCAKWVYFNGKIPEGYQVDHVIPIINGGTNKLSNLRLSTPKENSNNPLSRMNQSNAKKKLWADDEYRNKMFEIRNSEDYKKKESEAHKGKKWKFNEEACNKVYQYSNSELIAIYYSEHDAERQTGFNRERIRFHCEDGKPYKGYIWRHNPL